MAEPTQYTFTYKEVVEALIKQQGIHEGTWGIYIEFGIQGANAGPSPDQLMPAAIVPVVKIGLQRVEADKPLPGAVDASVANPRSALKASAPA